MVCKLKKPPGPESPIIFGFATQSMSKILFIIDGFVDFPAIYQILRMSCSACHRVLLPGRVKALLIAQLKVLEMGLITEAQDLEDVTRSMVSDAESEACADVLVKDELTRKLLELESKMEAQLEDTSLLEFFKNQFLIDALKHQVVKSEL